MKIRLVGAELFHTDRHDEASSRYSEFRERAKQTVRVSQVGVTGTLSVSNPIYSDRFETSLWMHL